MNDPRPPVIVVPQEVVQSLITLSHAVNGPVTLVGGWAVRCRLQMGFREARPTSDLDVLITSQLRPAAAALDAAVLVQDDPQHPCRLSGLPLLVDLLAEGPQEILQGADPIRGGMIEDADGLRLLVPPMASLLSALTGEVVLQGKDPDSRATALLPCAGALFASKVGNVALEEREPGKRASDAEDALRLLEGFGAAALLHDLGPADPAAVTRLRGLLEAMGSSALLAQARLSGYEPDAAQVTHAIDRMLDAL